MDTNRIGTITDREELVARAARSEIERRKRLYARKGKAEADLVEFIRMFWGVLEPETPLIEGWALYALCDFLMAASAGHIVRGLINVPPGFMKSLGLNVFWPAWEWGPQNKPHLRYISASYKESLPERDNARFIRLVKDPVYRSLWGDRFTLIKESLSWVENDRTGWKRTTSTHSGTTGYRGDRMLIDDANDPNDVESEDVRGATTHWIREVMPDRLNDLERSVVINLQQRVHEGDATGVLAKYGVGYTQNWLMIPMRFDPLRATPVVLKRDAQGEPSSIWMDPRGTDTNGDELEGIVIDKDGKPSLRLGSPMAKAEGVLAWPERFSATACDALEIEKGSYAWANQYQQTSAVRGGGLIREDWWLPWTDPVYPDMGTTILALDTAVEENEEADYNAATVWGAFSGKEGEPRLMLMAAWQARLPLAQLVARIAELCEKHRVDYLLIEHKTRGRDVHDEIRRLYRTASWQTVLVKVERSKWARLKAVSGLFSGDVRRMPFPGKPGEFFDVWSGGIVHAPNKDWAEEVIDQVSGFGRMEHDDYVDTVSLALEWVRKNGVVVRKVEYDEDERARKMYKPPIKVPYVI